MNSMKISKTLFLVILVAIKILGVIFATFIFAKYSPLIDSELYLKGFYTPESIGRTRLVNDLAYHLNNFMGKYLTHFFFAILSVSGLIYYCFTCNRRWVFLIFLLFPSSLVWTSIVGKDAIFFGAFGMALIIWSKYASNQLNILDQILLLFSTLICLLMRPHYSVALLWLFFSILVLKKLGGKAFLVLIILLIVGAVIGYFTVLNELLLRGFGGIDPLARASRFVELGINHNSADGFEQFKRLVPLGFIYGVIGPLPSEVINRIEFLPFFIEGLIILLFPVFVWIFVKMSNLKSKDRFFIVFWWCLVPAITMLMIIHAPFGLLNPGSASRWRVDFEQVFYLAPLLLFFRLIDDEKNSIASLPS